MYKKKRYMFQCVPKTFALAFFAFCTLNIFAQITTEYTDADRYYKTGLELFERANFGVAKQTFQQAEQELAFQFDERSKLLRTKSQYMIAKSALNGGFPEGEKLILDFYRNNRPDPLTYLAIKDIANIKYERRLYTEAITLYNLIDVSNISKSDRIEVLFKKGYCYFVKKDFVNAEKALKPILGEESIYTNPTYYYMGMVNFFQGDYENSVDQFFKLKNDKLYSSFIPYYIAQIYFARKEYDKVIDYVPQQLKNADLNSIKEIRHILGQAYFIKNDYVQALPHLEYYESNSKKMRKEDFYQLAFTQYSLGLFAKAAENFKELSKLDSKLGQVSNHYLADCYLKTGNKEDARVSFKNVTNLNYDQELYDEATFNFGKLSAELGYDRAAITAFISLPETSNNFIAAQDVLGSLFESTKDYEMVITTIEGMKSQSPRIKEAYQKVCLESGIQLIKDGNRKNAKLILLKGVKVPASQEYSALIYYYLADIYHNEAEYQESISVLNKYFTLSSLVYNLPENARLHNANYLQAYNYLKLKNYGQAAEFLTKSLTLMKQEGYETSADLRQQRLFADVVSRLGDCYFTFNKYDEAIRYYNIASKLNFPGQDYAFFQQSMIKGLQGKYYDKIVLLETLVKTIPNSSMLDDAYFQMGETHMILENNRAAELAYSNILELKNKSILITRALLKLGLIAYNKGDVPKATKYYTDIFKNNPNKNEAKEAINALEEIYIQDLGRADEFMNLLEKHAGYQLTSLEKDSLSYLAAQGRFDNGEYIEAINSYSKYIDNYPKGLNRLKALYNRAESNTILKKYSAAIPDYEAIIKLGQNEYYEDAIYKAALISYNDLQQFAAAFNYYSLLDEITKDKLIQYEAQIGGLRSAYRVGNLDAILHMANKVINNSLSTKEDKALANFYSGKMNYVIKSWEPALANLSQVVMLVDNANAAESKYLINDIYFKQNKIALAEENALETISNSTSYPFWVAKNLILLSDIFMVKKDFFNAKAALEAVIENFPETDDITKEAHIKLAAALTEEAKMTRIQDTSEILSLDTIKSND